MLLTRRKRGWEEMLRDESEAIRKQYEDEKDAFIENYVYDHFFGPSTMWDFSL